MFWDMHGYDQNGFYPVYNYLEYLCLETLKEEKNNLNRFWNNIHIAQNV